MKLKSNEFEPRWVVTTKFHQNRSTRSGWTGEDTGQNERQTDRQTDTSTDNKGRLKRSARTNTFASIRTPSRTSNQRRPSELSSSVFRSATKKARSSSYTVLSVTGHNGMASCRRIHVASIGRWQSQIMHVGQVRGTYDTESFRRFWIKYVDKSVTGAVYGVQT